MEPENCTKNERFRGGQQKICYIFLLILPLEENTMGFKKGFDAKRFVPTNDGMMNFYKELNGLLRQQSLEAFTFLVDTMNNDKASLKLRATVAMDILNRGVGKPVDVTVVATITDTIGADASKIDTAQLESIINNASVIKDNEKVIDGDFIESL